MHQHSVKVDEEVNCVVRLNREIFAKLMFRSNFNKNVEYTDDAS